MEETDRRQIGLDGGGRFSLLLHIEDVGGQVFAVDVRQLLQTIFLRKEFAEPLHGLVISLLGAEAALSIVPGNLVQLGGKGLVDTGILRFYCHSIAPYFTDDVQMGIVCPVAQAAVSARFLINRLFLSLFFAAESPKIAGP